MNSRTIVIFIALFSAAFLAVMMPAPVALAADPSEAVSAPAGGAAEKAPPEKKTKPLRIKWFGHAMFLLDVDGARVLIDPFDDIGYPVPKETIKCEACIVSHDHRDHNNTRLAGGACQIMKAAGSYHANGANITLIETMHDKNSGKDRGKNLVSVIERDDFRIVHMGDIGHVISDETARKIGRVDVLLIPVGGFFTIDAFDAWETIRLLSPRVIIPMHYRTEKLDPKLPIDTIDKFIAGRSAAERLPGDTCEIDMLSLPKEEKIIVFNAGE